MIDLDDQWALDIKPELPSWSFAFRHKPCSKEDNFVESTYAGRGFYCRNCKFLITDKLRNKAYFILNLPQFITRERQNDT